MKKLLSGGLFKKAIAEFGHEINAFDLPEDGRVEYAQWLHPKERTKAISQAMIDALRVYVRPGDLVIDIGAHTGDTSVPMALAAGVDGCCLALEPNPYVYKVLEVNGTLNREKTNLVTRNYAATDHDGTFTFHYSDAGFCNGGYLSNIRNKRHGHRFALEIQGKNLEHVLREEFSDRLEKLSYIKIDTEGYDRFVIQSLSGILKEFQPVIRTEILKKLTLEERQSQFEALRDAGYACFSYDEASYSKGEPIAEGDLMRWKQFDMLAIPKATA